MKPRVIALFELLYNGSIIVATVAAVFAFNAVTPHLMKDFVSFVVNDGVPEKVVGFIVVVLSVCVTMTFTIVVLNVVNVF